LKGDPECLNVTIDWNANNECDIEPIDVLVLV